MTLIAAIQIRDNRVGYCLITEVMQFQLGCHLDRPPFNKTIHVLEGTELIILAPCVPSQPFTKAFKSVGTVGSKYYNKEQGIAIMKEYGIGIDAHLEMPAECYEALNAAWMSAELQVVKSSLKFKFANEADFMILEESTVMNLELVNGKSSLISILDATRTKMGYRLLHSSILSPSLDLDEIRKRQNAIQELYDGQISDLDQQLGCFPDLERLCADIAQVKSTERAIGTILGLKKALIDIGILEQTMSFQAPILQEAFKAIRNPKLGSLLDLIARVINEDATQVSGSNLMRHQRCYAVKPNFSPLLDVARQAYKEAIDDTYALFKSLCEEHELPKMRLQHTNAAGFFLQMAQEPPCDFINVVKTGRMWRFSTLDLIKANARIQDSLLEVYNLSDRIIADLMHAIQQDLEAMYEVSSAIGMIDFLLSLAKVAIKEGYIRPEFHNALAIKGGRHPIKERFEVFVANDTFANDRARFQLITGANMSGKSTYVKQVALLSIMAQIGSFVPAEYASFRTFDRILTRLANDNIPKIDHSSFSLELTEADHIVRNVTSCSLVIIDEFGRGTATTDALGIAFALSEALIKSNALVFFVTHLEQLASALDLYPAVHSQYLETTLNPWVHHHRMAEGRGESHGLECAKMLGMPEDILSIAGNIQASLASNSTIDTSEATKVKKTVNALYQISEAPTDDTTLLSLLRTLK